MIELPKKIKSDAFNKFFLDRLKLETNQLIQVSLKEDLDENGDVTSNAILAKEKQGIATIIAKQHGVFSGGFVVKMVYSYIDQSVKVNIKTDEGDLIKEKQSVIEIKGPVKSILIGERTALNFLARMSGVATLTHQFIEKLKGSNIKILDTRKTNPGWRYLDKYSVSSGGGKNHRIGLFDMVLIKENHIAAAGSIENAVQLCRDYLRAKSLELKIEVETKDLKEVKQALALKVDRIMLDNMNLQQIKQAVEIVNGKTELEISGGVNLENVDEYYDSGVDFISVGQLTHSANAFDFSMILG